MRRKSSREMAKASRPASATTAMMAAALRRPRSRDPDAEGSLAPIGGVYHVHPVHSAAELPAILTGAAMRPAL
jgi:hypothetical protein